MLSDRSTHCVKIKIALLANDLPLIQKLLKDPSLAKTFFYENNVSIILYAIRHGCENIRTLLDDRNVVEHINVSDEQGNTPLSLACALHNFTLVESLLKRGAEATWEDFNKAMPYASIQQVLLPYLTPSSKRSAKPSLFEQLYSAMINGEYKKALGLAKYVDYLPPELKQKIIDLAENDLNLPMLVKMGIDINNWRSSPSNSNFLHRAVAEYNLEAITYILNNTQIDINQQNDKGETVLHLAIKNSNNEMVKMLLSKEADPNIVNNKGFSPLYIATKLHREEIVETLLGHGADPFLGDPNAIDRIWSFTNKIKTLFLPYIDRENTTCISPLFSHDYTQQVVIDYIGNARGLKDKWDKKNDNPCHLIRGIKFEEQKGNMNIPFSNHDVIRIYIHAHGAAGDAILVGGQGKATDYQIYLADLARYLANFIGKHDVVINLTACYGGKGNEKETPDNASFNSFAAKLHKELVLIMQRDIPVVARTEKLWLHPNGRKSTSPLSAPSPSGPAAKKIHHQPGSKVVFIGKEETRLDVYSHNWKEAVLEAISDAEKHTRLREKSAFLTNWLTQFSNMRPKEIFDMLSSELEKQDTVLRRHSAAFFSPTRLFDAYTYKKLMPLVIEGGFIFDSPFTAEHPIMTGVRLS